MLPAAVGFEPAEALDGGTGRPRRDPSPARSSCRSASRRTGSRSSRSEATRARRSPRSRSNACRGGRRAIRSDLAGLPRVALHGAARRAPCRPGAHERDAGPPRRPRPRRDAHRRRPAPAAADRGHDPSRRPERRPGGAGHGAHDVIGAALCPRARPAGADHRAAGSGDPRDAGARERPDRPPAPPPAACRTGRPRRHGLVPGERPRAPRQRPGADGRPGGRGAGRRLLALELRADRGRSGPRRLGAATGHQDHRGGGAAGRGGGASTGAGGLRRTGRPHGQPPALPGVPGPGGQQGSGGPAAWLDGSAWTSSTSLPSATSSTTAR